jgi:hypothetical protein
LAIFDQHIGKLFILNIDVRHKEMRFEVGI